MAETPILPDLRILIELSESTALILLSPEGNIVSSNAGAYLAGYACGEIIGKHYSCLFAEEDRVEDLPHRMLLHAQRAQLLDSRIRRVRRDGSQARIRVILCALYDTDGVLAGFADVSQFSPTASDDPHYSNVLQTIARQYHYLLHLFEQAPGFMCVFGGCRHVFELANKSYLELVGVRDLIGKPVRDALPQIEAQGFFELLDDVFESGEPFVGQELPVVVQCRADGRPLTRYVNCMYQPVTGSDGQVIGIFVQGTDVTARKTTRDAQHVRRNESDAPTAKRAPKIGVAPAALEHGQKLESIGDLAGGIAHDFNNILQVIGGSLQLLQQRMDGDKDATMRIGVAMEAVERGARLSSQLLTFARRQPLRPAVIKLSRIVHSMEGLIRDAVGKTIVVETVAPVEDLWNAQVDPALLEQVVLHLATNARDAMPYGGRLTIETSNMTVDDRYVMTDADIPAGQYVLLTLSDSGVGMAVDVLKKACAPFFTTKRKGAGIGLGLSMAYGFVKQSGGHFNIYSEAGYGTTVRMYFPRSREPEVEPAPPLEDIPAAGGHETVLAVDDDAGVLAIVTEMLRGLGYQVLQAPDPDTALTILKSGSRVDVLFTDAVMPGRLPSAEFARQAKALQPHIEILFTSGYTQNAITHGGSLAPGVQLLSKPYNQKQLAGKLRELLGNRHACAGNADISLAARKKKKHILLVEDNDDAREMTQELVSLLGNDVRGTATAEEALRLLDETHYDVLITDLRLPGMSGIELAARASERQPDLKIIFATGNRDRLREHGVNEACILTKPYSIKQLARALELA